MEEKKLMEIAISKIIPHPQNPRKNLGDLTELTASIRSQGILQNLTVLPWECVFDDEPHDGIEYVALIGHRRLAAAKAAGLAEVPCAIVEMDEIEQQSVMLSENLQRADLTVVEQAEGMQLMMDLGSNVDEIADLTGMSGSSVRRRLDVARLPKNQLHEAEERGGATLAEYIEIASLKKESNQKKALAQVGTNNFRWNLDNLKREEKSEEGKKRLIAEAEKLGAIKYPKKDPHPHWNLEQIRSIAVWKDLDLEKAEGKKIKPGDFWFVYNDVFYILRVEKKTKTETPKKSDAELLADERRKALDRFNKDARETRENFVKRFTATTKFREVIQDAFIEVRTAELLEYIDTDWDILFWAVGKERKTKYERLKMEELMTLTASDDNLLFLVYACMGDVETLRPYDEGWGERPPKWQSDKAKKFRRIYDFLEKLGYETSDDERAFLAGTHALYREADDASL